uniref:Secreted protein n=1 Tax=Tanacetum cinerariifolium TaxID=118510 RepID=A0A699X761_TANCI|nr:hypothetical protein [Tanacetum cinerariifolium]
MAVSLWFVFVAALETYTTTATLRDVGFIPCRPCASSFLRKSGVAVVSALSGYYDLNLLCYNGLETYAEGVRLRTISRMLFCKLSSCYLHRRWGI